MFFKNQQKGFTLVEVLVAMSIFVIFAGILINSYISIVRSQREANEYRVLYSEARDVFETLVSEFREGMIDYRFQPGSESNVAAQIVSKDGRKVTRILFEPGDEMLEPATLGKVGTLEAVGEPCANPAFSVQNDEIYLNSNKVNVEEFQVLYSPVKDPYDIENVNYSTMQFQPKVTIYAVFSQKMKNGEVYKVDLQTTVSSRIYNQVCPNLNEENS